MPKRNAAERIAATIRARARRAAAKAAGAYDGRQGTKVHTRSRVKFNLAAEMAAYAEGDAME